MQILVDVYERDASGRAGKVGTKLFGPAAKPLSKWVKRPKGTTVRPPMNGALYTASTKEKIKNDRAVADALGYLKNHGNDMQQQQRVVLTSGPNADGAGWSITPSNFEQSMLIMAIRLIPKHTWLNNYDQFNVPNEQHPAYAQFKLDAIVWALFSGRNNTSSLHPVSYKGTTYDIENHFFWTDPARMNAVQDKPMPIIHQLRTAQRRFVTDWLNANLAQCSPDAQQLVQAANLLVLDTLPDRKNAQAKWQLDRWDAGWYQLRMWVSRDVANKWGARLKQVYDLHRTLGARLRPLVYDLECLPVERRYEDQELQEPVEALSQCTDPEDLAPELPKGYWEDP